MNDTALVGTIPYLTRLGVPDCRSDIGCHCTHFGVRHQATGAQNLTQLTDNTHGVRAGDYNIEIHIAGLNRVGQIIHTDNVCTGFLRRVGIGALGKYGDTNRLAGTVR